MAPNAPPPGTGETSPPSTQAPLAQAHHTPSRVRLAIAATAVWLTFLVGLALFTSNPLTFNRVQLAAADAVVHVRVEDLSQGRCRVLKQISGPAVPEQLVLRNLGETSAQPLAEYIIPLTMRSGGSAEVTWLLPSAQFPEGIPPRIYPATPQSTAQLDSLWRSLPRTP